ncbi:MAG: glycine dehydrogenase subunit 1 [Candidatus Saganbacteria bacterium]|uniref:glycine dehydrogenase (aminomethyl-transferring) n=1 Tax=Candidatus Saganbacteria bacterium TaxID=2575572 RepID=A0A833P3I8_UNCSA|nr:MAG: glycine dehydrogenase subunit 1 [Candidatus Saganbacteria bacterium]
MTFFNDVPESVKLKHALSLPDGLSEPELLNDLENLSQKNIKAASNLGAGCYNHFIPSALKHIVGRSEFYTAYTPYQAEASQGTLQVIYEYQSLICALTAMDVANASMYDGATALAEAVLLALRHTGRNKVLVSSALHPNHRKALKTYAASAEFEIEEVPFDNKSGKTIDVGIDKSCAAYIISQPNFFGCIEDVLSLADKAHAAGALFIVSVDPISLGILKPPGEYGADIVVGEGQSLGNARNFGGPGLGIFTVKNTLIRQIPGRLVGKTVDLEGKQGYTLTLQTREQHIRRERAPSNICSNEALCALAACVYLSLMGKNGLKKVAEICLRKSNKLKKELGSPFSAPTFKEFVTKANKGISLKQFYPELKDYFLVCSTELS